MTTTTFNVKKQFFLFCFTIITGFSSYSQTLIWETGFNEADGLTAVNCTQTSVSTWLNTTCIPPGWLTGRIETSGTGKGWRGSATIQWDRTTAQTDNTRAGLDFEPTTSTSEYGGLMTQGAVLTAGVPYTLEFYWRMPGSSGGGTWKIDVGVTTSNAQQTMPSLTNILSTSNNNSWSQICYRYIPSVTGTYYFYLKFRNSTIGSSPVRMVIDDMKLYSNTVNTGCITNLPVSLNSFNANCTDNGVSITWNTATEHNSQKFVVEKSRDDQNWRVLEEVQAAGNSTSPIDYEVKDRAAFGTSYYRLRQVDFDGQEEVYRIISVDCDNMQSAMSVFPNPTDNLFTVVLEAARKVNDASLCVVDLNGRIVNQRLVNLLPGTNTVQFDDLELQNGSYFVKVLGDDANDFTPVKLMIQK